MTVADDLAEWLSDETGEPVRIEAIRRATTSFSRENWMFDATWDGQRHALVARRDPVGSVLDTDRRIEVALLRAMVATDVPVPVLRFADLDGGRLGRPALVMDLVPGTCDGFVLNGTRSLERRLGIAERLYGHLADIHRVDWRSLGLGEHLDDPGTEAAAVALDGWERQLRDVQLDPQPELAYVIAWLRANAPASPRTVIVHGDFKPGNVLLDGDEISAVLDWETAHLGDPHEDLGWVTNPLRAGEHRIADAWEPQDLLDHWSRRTGWPVDPLAVHWWQVFANVKLAVIVLRGVHDFVDGRMDRLFNSPVRLYGMLLDQIAQRDEVRA